MLGDAMIDAAMGRKDESIPIIFLDPKQKDMRHATIKASQLWYIAELIERYPAPMIDVECDVLYVQWALIPPNIYNTIKPEAWCEELLEGLLNLPITTYFDQVEVSHIMKHLKDAALDDPRAVALLELLS